MAKEQQVKLTWSCIPPAGNKDNPTTSDDYILKACASTLKLFQESEEYLQMKTDAESWRNYSEECESLQKKLSVNWDKVEKWDKLINAIQECKSQYGPLDVMTYGSILINQLG